MGVAKCLGRACLRLFPGISVCLTLLAISQYLLAGQGISRESLSQRSLRGENVQRFSV